MTVLRLLFSFNFKILPSFSLSESRKCWRILREIEKHKPQRKMSKITVRSAFTILDPTGKLRSIIVGEIRERYSSYRVVRKPVYINQLELVLAETVIIQHKYHINWPLWVNFFLAWKTRKSLTVRNSYACSAVFVYLTSKLTGLLR